MALSGGSQGGEFTSAFGRVAEVHGRMASAAYDANDPKRPLADARAHLRKGMLWNVRDKRWISPA
jgi:hypothetical protein